MNRIAALLLTCITPGALTASHPPAALLNLTAWKLILPIDTDLPGRPDEIVQPRLSTFSDPSHFFLSADGTAVIFRASCGGVTTKGSSYPRSELREMQPDAHREAAWSTTEGLTHELHVKAAITRVPKVKPHVVCVQIHDAKDDLLMVRLEGTRLFIERNNEPYVMRDPQYALGSVFDLRIRAADGRIRVWLSDQQKLNWQVSRRGCYFKAGCYTQSNPQRGDLADDTGEVAIYALGVTHDGGRR
jgi:poly(beta-D-mannuronate) lyase